MRDPDSSRSGWQQLKPSRTDVLKMDSPVLKCALFPRMTVPHWRLAPFWAMIP